MEQDNGRENFKIGLDTEQLDSDAQGARAAFESLGAAAEGVGKQIDQSLGKTDASALRKEMAETEKAIKEVQNCIANNSREVEEFKNKIEEAQAQLANGGDKDTLTAQVQGYRDTIAAITDNSREFAAEQAQLQSSLSSMNEQWSQLSAEAQKAGVAQKEATEAFNTSAIVSAAAQNTESTTTTANTGAIIAKSAAESQAAEATVKAADAANNAASAFGAQSNTVTDLRSELKMYSDALKIMEERLNALPEIIRRQEAATERSRRNLENLRAQGASGEADLNTQGGQAYLIALENAYKAAVQRLGDLKREEESLKNSQWEYTAAVENTKNKIKELGKAHTECTQKAREYKAEAEKIPTINSQIADTMKTIGKMTAGYFTVKGIQNFIEKCIEVRKNLELMEVHFKGLMGDAGTELLGEIKKMAMDSGVYTTKVLSEVAQTLNVYGIETEQIMPLLRDFGDVAMGNEQKLSSLAMAFGRLETQGQLSSLTLRTFTRAGFNPLEEMARKTGKSMQQLRAEMSAGLITTQKVKDALKSATSQGGKFYHMTENISDSIAAEQGRLRQMITKIYAEWGKSHEDMIKGGYQLAQTVVSSYEVIGKSIASLIAVYGIYRAALIVNTAVESGRVASLFSLATAQRIATAAQAKLNAVCMANPFVLMGAAIAGLTAALFIWGKTADAAKAAQDRVNKTLKDGKSEFETKREAVRRDTETLEGNTVSTEEQKEALARLREQYPKLLKYLKDEKTYLENINNFKRESAIIDANNLKNKAAAAKANAKLNLDAAQSAYDEIANRPQENRDQYYAQALRNAVQELNAARAAYNTAVAGYKEAAATAKRLTAAAEEETTIHNKKYYEHQRQSAQTRLEAMDISQKGSKEWLKAEREFMEADEKLSAYKIESYTTRNKKEQQAQNKELDGKKKAAEILRKWNEEQAKIEENAEWNRRQAVIDAMEEGSQKQLEQLRLNHDKEMAEIDRESKELWKARIEYQKKLFEAKPENKHKNFYESDTYKALLPEDEKHPLTKEEEDKVGLTAKREGADARYIREQKAILLAEQQAMQDYLKQYGTLQEQKLALDREYAEKRRKIMESSDTEEQKRWQLASLNQQHSSETSKLNAQRLAMDIDWGATFGDIGHVLGDIAEETLRRVEAYMKTAEFKNLSAADKQSYTTLRQNLKNEVGNNASVFNFSIWGDIQNDIREYRASVKKVQDANVAHNVAVAQLAASEKKLSENTDETQKDMLQFAVNFNRRRVEQTASDVQDAKAESDASKENLENDANKAAAGIQNFQNAMQQLSSGSLKGFADGVTNLISNLTKTDDAAGAASKGLAGLGKIGGIVGAILAIIDALGDDPARFIRDLLEKIEKVVEQIIADLPNLVGNIIGGVINVVKGIFSGFIQMFGGDALGEIGVSDKDYEEDMERLRQSNNDLAYAIDSLAEIMIDQAGAEATATYEKQKADLEQREKNLQEDIYRSGTRSSKGILGIGSKGSTRRYIDENMNADDWERVSQAAGVSVTNANEFFRLTSEQMHNVATYASAEWTKIMLHASDGMESIEDQLNEYIDLWSEADDALRNYQETLTSLSFDSLKDSMAELLESSETDTEDVIDNINKYLQKAIINTVLTKAGQKRLEEWYTSFADAMSDGVMTATEAAALRTSYAQIYDDVNKQYEAAMQAAGLDPEDFDDEDSGDSGSWESLGEETGRALEGRFAALQIQTTKIADIVAAQYEANTQGNTQRITALSEMNNLVFTCSEHLERIASNTDALPRMEKKLEYIKTNTDRL